MSMSDNNTNELDSYGVWVKNSNQDSTTAPEASQEASETSIEDSSLDLPDFDDAEFSDMFNVDSQFASDETTQDDSFADDLDSTLSTDELANITDGDDISIEQVEAPQENTNSDLSSDLSLDDFEIEEPSFENEETAIDEAELSLDEPVFEEAPTFETEETDETAVTEKKEDEEISFDESSADEKTIEEEFAIDEAIEDEVVTKDDTEETTVDNASEEDNFAEATEVSSTEAAESDITETADETVETSEENAVETSDESEEVSFGDDEEISLDDFMDGGFSDESVAAGNNGFEPGAEPQKVEISDTNLTEELSLDDFMDGDAFESAPAEAKEEVVNDEPPLEMDINFDSSAESVQTEANISLDNDYEDETEEEDTTEVDTSETEEISLDDFSEKPVEPVEEHKASNDENINTEDIDLSDFGIDANAEETPITQDVEESKTKDVIVDYDLAVGDENTTAAPVVNEIKSDASVEDAQSLETVTEVQETAPAAGGDYARVDNSLLQQIVTDLSGLKDEINLLKTNLEEIKAHEAVSNKNAAEAVQNYDDEPISQEIVIDETKDEGGFFNSDDEDETIALSFDELDNIMNTAEFSETVEASLGEETSSQEIEDTVVEPEEPTFEETAVTAEEQVEPETEETVIEDNVLEENKEDSIEEDINTEGDPELSFEYKDEDALEEPEMNNITLDGEDEAFEDDLPGEITIPKEDEMIIESNNTDFMDSVKETSDDTSQLPEDLPSEIEEPVIEETAIDEPVIEETAIDDSDIPTVADVIANDAEDETKFATVDSFVDAGNTDNNLSESNIDYLTTKETASTEESTDLKQDIKSVLLYMDQLLENLPEEKIVEFAKSEEFVTYKKLFSELGLS